MLGICTCPFHRLSHRGRCYHICRSCWCLLSCRGRFPHSDLVLSVGMASHTCPLCRWCHQGKGCHKSHSDRVPFGCQHSALHRGLALWGIHRHQHGKVVLVGRGHHTRHSSGRCCLCRSRHRSRSLSDHSGRSPHRRPWRIGSLQGRPCHRRHSGWDYLRHRRTGDHTRGTLWDRHIGLFGRSSRRGICCHSAHSGWGSSWGYNIACHRSLVCGAGNRAGSVHVCIFGWMRRCCHRHHSWWRHYICRHICCHSASLRVGRDMCLCGRPSLARRCCHIFRSVCGGSGCYSMFFHIGWGCLGGTLSHSGRSHMRPLWRSHCSICHSGQGCPSHQHKRLGKGVVLGDIHRRPRYMTGLVGRRCHICRSA